MPQKYLPYVEKAYNDILELRKSLTGNTELINLYLCTAISNTAALLTAPCNSIDKGSRFVHFSEEKELFTLIQAVARSFFSSIHSTCELGIDKLLEKLAAPAISTIEKKNREKLATFTSLPEGLKDWIESLINGAKPTFEDKLNTLLSLISLEKKRRACGENFLKL